MSELAQGFISLSVALDEPGADLAKFFGDTQKQAKKTGDAIGSALTAGVKDGAEKARAEMARLQVAQKTATQAAEDARGRQAAAARKVEIAEAKLNEMRAAGKSSASQLLAAEDRLESAKSGVAKAALAVVAAERKQQDATDAARKAAKAQTDATLAQAKALNSLADEALGTERKVDRSFSGMLKSVRSLKIPGRPFKGVSDEASTEGKKAGRTLVQAVDRESRKQARSSKLGSGLLAGIAGGAGGLAATAGASAGSSVVSLFGESTNAAADLEQSIGAVDTIFKQSSKQMHAWGQNAVQSVGLSENAYNELATVLGAQLKNGGTSLDQLGAKTNDLIGVGADLSSMFGGSTKDAVEAISSALKGERDPIERYGVSLKQAAIDAKAADLGFKKIDGTFSNQAQQAATLALIMEQTKDATGNFAKEADTAAQKQQKLAAAQENLKASAGELLQPLKMLAIDRGMKLVEWADKMAPKAKEVADGIGGVVSILTKGDFQGAGKTFGLEEDSKPVEILFRIRDAFTEVKGGIVAFRESWKAFDGDVTSSGFPGFMERLAFVARTALEDVLIPKLRELAAWFTSEILPRLRTLATEGKQNFDKLSRVATEFAAAFMEKIHPFIPTIKDAMSQIGGIITGALDLIRAVVNRVTTIITWVWDRWGDRISTLAATYFGGLAQVIGGALKIVRGVIQTITGLISGDWGKAWDGVKSIARGALDVVLGFIKTSGIASAFSAVVESIKVVWGRLSETIARPVNAVIDIINKGILEPFNKVAELFGSDKRATLIAQVQWGTPAGGGAKGRTAFASGGILPGYTPGRDVHEFYSPTAGRLSLSGGEPIMRPEFGRLVGGESAINMLNMAARRGRRALMAAFDMLGHGAFKTGGIVNFRGGRFTAEFAKRLRMAEGLAGAVMQVTQGGWRPATSYSGTSHRGDAIDISGAGFQRFIGPLRQVGIPTWDRTGKGNWIAHAHGVPLPGSGTALGSAIWQAQDYLRGGDGLGGRDSGPRGGGISGALSGLWQGVKDVAGKLVHDFKGLFQSGLDRLGELGSSPFAQMLGGMARTVASTITDGAKDLVGLQSGGTVGRSTVAALSEDGMPELVVGPQMRRLMEGSRVYSWAETQKLMGGGSDEPRRIVGTLTIPGLGEGLLDGYLQDAQAGAARRGWSR
ncbi:hypothetical protein ACSDQ9_05755 [Aestuariimicrobium soli]|uniref:hypothetical protein n=1 Tax=Aestuariimicrobium soli TaxID=2035834 RepID=UPI003EBF13E8